MFTALVSMLTGFRVRHDVAMTGEITLRGRVLPIGGLKEKVLAAHRAGIKRVLVPERNKADLDEVPAEVKNDLEFVFVSKMDQVLEAALEEMPKPKADEKRRSRHRHAPRTLKRRRTTRRQLAVDLLGAV
jgi:ATP-dependent Lon protease